MEAGVSYVVTVYNKAPFLPTVLASIAAECVATGGEIILVDDGSTDQSPAILADFVATRPYVKVITQENVGVAAATNIGIVQASYPYLRLVDGDDVLVAGSTQTLLDALQTSDCGFAFGRFAADSPLPLGEVDRRSRAGEGSSHSPHPNPLPVGEGIVSDPLRLMLTNQPFIPSTTLAVTSLLQQVLPLPTQYKTAQDFALGLKLARLTDFARIETICCLSPAQSQGLSSSKARMFRDTVLLARDIGLEQNWAGRYRRLAMTRNAGRARNYLRRHVSGAGRATLAVTILAIVTRVPFLWPYRRVMTYIARTYDVPLASIQDHA